MWYYTIENGVNESTFQEKKKSTFIYYDKYYATKGEVYSGNINEKPTYIRNFNVLYKWEEKAAIKTKQKNMFNE